MIVSNWWKMFDCTSVFCGWIILSSLNESFVVHWEEVGVGGREIQPLASAQ